MFFNQPNNFSTNTLHNYKVDDFFFRSTFVLSIPFWGYFFIVKKTNKIHNSQFSLFISVYHYVKRSYSIDAFRVQVVDFRKKNRFFFFGQRLPITTVNLLLVVSYHSRSRSWVSTRSTANSKREFVRVDYRGAELFLLHSCAYDTRPSPCIFMKINDCAKRRRTFNRRGAFDGSFTGVRVTAFMLITGYKF